MYCRRGNGQPARCARFAALAAVLFWAAAEANLSGARMEDYVAYPAAHDVAPPVAQTMLVMSLDHQYFFEAYNDYTDLNQDGVLDASEITYDNGFVYYGYFDPDKCYDYVAQSFPATGLLEHFRPAAFTPDHYCDAVAGAWSGNFLNWATMTRMDVTRKFLYGGARMVDDAADTILERAHLPTDGHAFAKTYNGDDLGRLTPFAAVRTDNTNGGDADGIHDRDEGITICNTSEEDGPYSHETDREPLARIVAGNFALWDAAERWQCRFDENATNANNSTNSGIDASSSEPNAGPDGLTEGSFGPGFSVRVAACVDGLIAQSNDHERCRRYPDGNHKPAGVLQAYGEDLGTEFGLLTGSYDKHVRGGVLRKNIGPIDDEVNVDSDGSFVFDPSSVAPQLGIIATLDRIRIYGYRYSNGVYFGADDNCGFREKGLDDESCFSWGNPLSEMYAETVRYFAGLTPTPAFVAVDDAFVAGLDEEETWIDPYGERVCGPRSALVIGSGPATFDQDDLGVFTDIEAGGVDPLTDLIGGLEEFGGGNPSQTALLGRRIGFDEDELCTAKEVSVLSLLRGTCTLGRTLNGGYGIAGVAWHAHTQDLRDDLDGTQSLRGVFARFGQEIPRLPVPVPVPGYASVVLSPQISLFDCIDNANGNGESCNPNLGTRAAGQLTKLVVVEPHHETTPGSGLFSAKFYANFEVSEAGGDFDQDMWGTYDYLLDTTVSPPTLTVTTDVHAESTSAGVLFGFTLTGTTSDGFHAYSGLNNAIFEDPDPAVRDCSADESDGTCRRNDPARSHTFTVSAGFEPPEPLLPDPLELAAKYGGFLDSNGNGEPDLEWEWDRKDIAGDVTGIGDGVADAYVVNPDLAQFTTVLERELSPVLTPFNRRYRGSSIDTPGLVVERWSSAAESDAEGRTATWLGRMFGLFEDGHGFVREDGNANGRLDDFLVDPVVEIFFDGGEGRHRARRHLSAEALDFVPAGSVEIEILDLRTVWDAASQLSGLQQLTAQRSYGDSAAQGRYLFTWLDDDYDGLVSLVEQRPFSAQTFDATNFGWLDVSDEAAADQIAAWVRGEEQAGFRKRLIDLDLDGSAEVHRLGDHGSGTAVAVGAPSAAYDLTAPASGYGAFKQHYAERRLVVYSATNDGLVRAINGGFFDPETHAFDLALQSETAHPLGAELWAYLPQNVLGHLQWLVRDDYAHVPLVDGNLRTFDARVFPPDADHPNGWGTLLVVAMGIGGGHDDNGIVLDTEGDGYGPANTDGDAADDRATRSAYVILDVTNPEAPPRVLAELKAPGTYLTTSGPAVFATGAGQWYLVAGSGPTRLHDGGITQSGRLFAWDLNALVAGVPAQVTAGPFTGGAAVLPGGDALLGSVTAFDRDQDLATEALYVGTAGGPHDPSGTLWRLSLQGQADPATWQAPFALLSNAERPFVAAPLVITGSGDEAWIVAASGRLLATADRTSTTQQVLLGFRDPNPLSGVPTSLAVDAGALVELAGSETLDNGEVEQGGVPLMSIGELADTIDNAGGWRRTLAHDPGLTLPAQRIAGRPRLVNGQLLANLFTPFDSPCNLFPDTAVGGETQILGVQAEIGIATPPLGAFGVLQACPGCAPGVQQIVSTIELGAGYTEVLPSGLDIVAPQPPDPPPITPTEIEVPALPLAGLFGLAMLFAWLGYHRKLRVGAVGR